MLKIQIFWDLESKSQILGEVNTNMNVFDINLVENIIYKCYIDTIEILRFELILNNKFKGQTLTLGINFLNF